MKKITLAFFVLFSGILHSQSVDTIFLWNDKIVPSGDIDLTQYLNTTVFAGYEVTDKHIKLKHTAEVYFCGRKDGQPVVFKTTINISSL